MLVKNCKIHRKTPLLESLFYRKGTPTQVFSFKFLEILNSSFFYRTPQLRATAFVNLYPLGFRSVFSLCFVFLIIITYTYIQITDTCTLNKLFVLYSNKLFTVFNDSCTGITLNGF